MPSWSTEKEVKLLLTIIKTTNTKITRTTWQQIASAMGNGYTQESVRQKFLSMKKGSEALDDKASGSNGDCKTTANTLAKRKLNPITIKINNKRKAPDSATDDEEDFAVPAKFRKLKVEDASETEPEDKDYDFVDDETLDGES